MGKRKMEQGRETGREPAYRKETEHGTAVMIAARILRGCT